MHFHIYLDDTTGQQLNAMAEQSGESRNALIRKTVSEWLAHQSQPQWPEIVVNFQGMADRREPRPTETARRGSTGMR